MTKQVDLIRRRQVFAAKVQLVLHLHVDREALYDENRSLFKISQDRAKITEGH
jgi:hypothetical protein